MRLQLNFKSGKPVYLQIVDQVHARVGRVASDNSSSMSTYLYYGLRNWNASAIRRRIGSASQGWRD